MSWTSSARLKASDGSALHIWGSGELLQTLIGAELVDEYRIFGSFRWCSAKESGCSKMASRHVVSL